MSRQRRRVVVWTAALAVAAGALSGCNTASAGEEDGQVLKIWWYETEDTALAQAWNYALEIFKEEHPGVEVQFELKTFDQMQQSGQLYLDSNQAPDVLEYNKGNATAGLVTQAGLVTDLTDVAAERGWDLDNSAQTVGLYDDGIMGSGNRYGVTNYGEFVTVWYNTEQFADLGLEVPTSLDEFEDVLKAFADTGVTPLALGSNDYFGGHLLYELALGHMDQSDWSDFQLFAGDPDWSAWEEAAQTIVDWRAAGYISSDSTGISAQDAGNAFIAGDYPLMVSGSWWGGQLDQLVAEGKVGEFLFPGNALHPGSGGNLWLVPEKAQNKELAYDFIDITLRPEVQNKLGQLGGVPVGADPSTLDSEVGKLLVGQFNDLLGAQEGGLAWYPDWPVAGLYDVQVAQVSDLVQGRVSPADAVQKIKAAYDAGKQDAGL